MSDPTLPFTRPPRVLHALAVAVVLGILIADSMPRAAPGTWLVALLGAGGTLLVLPRRRARTRLIMLLALAVAGTAATVAARRAGSPAHDLALHLAADADRPLVRIEGVVATAPDVREPVRGRLIPGIGGSRTVVEVDLLAAFTEDDARVPLRGRAHVVIDDDRSRLRIGDHVRLTGLFNPITAPRNPGEFDARPRATLRGHAGTILTAPGAVTVVGSRDDLPTNARRLRARVRAWLTHLLLAGGDTERRALLGALLLGARDAALDEVDDTFRRVGLSHLLAISGLHVGVLAGATALLLRWRGRRSRRHGVIIIAVIASYLLLVDVRMPVVRAGLMSIAACAGLVAGRHYHAGSLLSACVIGILLWRPDELHNPGFQLSVLVVLGLLELVPDVRRRWFGRRDPLLASAWRIVLLEPLKTGAAVSIVAWLVALPLVMQHFGMITPLAPALGLVAVPLTALALTGALARLLVNAIAPGAEWLLMIVDLPAAALAAFARLADDLPGATILVTPPGIPWTIAAMALIAVGLRITWSRRRVIVAVVLAAAMIGWFVTTQDTMPRAALRIDMLDVGDGSCYVVRTGGRAIMFDAGSATDPRVARRRLVPALRALGVRRLDAIIVSHANVDHFGAVLDLADALPVGVVQVSPQMSALARAGDQRDAAARLFDGLAARSVPVTTAACGRETVVGPSRWTWLHPPDDASFDAVNDASLVLRIAVSGRTVLLCGDIQRRAMLALLEREPSLRADVIELPHHGSFHDVAAAFVTGLDPRIVLQSTGPRRLRPDRWATLLADTERLITARDGASWVEIDADGSTRVGRFRRPD